MRAAQVLPRRPPAFAFVKACPSIQGKWRPTRPASRLISSPSAGTLYEKLGKLDKASADFTKAIELDGFNSSTYNSRGLVCDHQQQYEEAIADFTEAIRLDSTNATYYHNRGFSYRNIARYADAIADYTKAIELNPNSAAAYNNRGFAERKSGLYGLAIQDYTKSLELSPDNVRTFNNRWPGCCAESDGGMGFPLSCGVHCLKWQIFCICFCFCSSLYQSINSSHELGLSALPLGACGHTGPGCCQGSVTPWGRTAYVVAHNALAHQE